jgi:cytochrome c oxidase subunit 3
MSSITLAPRARPTVTRSNVGVGLWVFMGVATALFTLFIAAYLMRMASSDWSSIALPWQLGLSTALLVAGSVAMQVAAGAAHPAPGARARAWLHPGGACAAAILGAPLWGWQALQAARVGFTGNPAASFFYLLTALHGMHVLGGLVAWVLALGGQIRVRLCARYWHFLLAIWLLLYSTLSGLTPEIVRFICGTN